LYGMDEANRLSERINQLMKQPGRIDRKLKAAIDHYEKRIHQLKSIALLEDDCSLAEVYRAALDLADRTSRFLSSIDSVEKRFNELSTPICDIYRHVKPYINECEQAKTELHLSQLKDYIAYYEYGSHLICPLKYSRRSNIDAACLLDDDEVLVASIRDYLQFVYREAQSNEQKFELLLEDMSFPIVPSGYLEKSDSQTWEDEQLLGFTNAFKLLAAIETSYPLISDLTATS
uniref:Conserved oligomeric Golgi complex subunit 3 n=1 Tax=Echinostoma caproni TaxID=27848 RepID=A0A183B1U4_9TREM